MGDDKYDVAAALAGWRFAAVAMISNGQQPAEIVEVGVATLDGDAVGHARTWLVRPARPMIPAYRRAYGIGEQELAAAPPAEQILPQVASAVQERVLLAHRGVDCRDLLVTAAGGCLGGRRVVDTQRLAKRAWPSVRSFALGALAQRLRFAAPGPIGRVRYDATATVLVFLAAARCLQLPAERLCDLGEVPADGPTGGSPWP